jgi:3-oxoadipate enol-lactonase
LADCADDVAAACDELGVDRIIPVGYSMGGPIAQLIWHRHRDLVDGMVLCATSRNFRGSRGERAWFQALGGLSSMARLTPAQWRGAVARRLLSRRIETSPLQEWVYEELRRNDPRLLVEAGAALGRFSSHTWIEELDVPTAVVVTEHDRVVPPHRQRKLAASIPGATVHPVAGDHTACVDATRLFLPALLDACASVTARLPADTPGPTG